MDCVEIHQMEVYQAKAGQVAVCQVEARQQELPDDVPVFAATFGLRT